MHEADRSVQPSNVTRLVNGSAAARILVVGDVMLDEYVEGAVERISPEGPVPVVTVEGRRCLPGGAAHVAHVVTAMGAAVDLVGVIGDDHGGDRLVESCEEAGVDARGLVRERGRPTTHKTRIVCGSQQFVRLDHEVDDPVVPSTSGEVVARVREMVPVADAVLISDYGKGLLDDDVLAEVMELAKGRGVPVLVDPKGHDMSRYRGVTVLKLNLAELAAAVGADAPAGWDSGHLVELAGRVRDDSESPVVVVTMGAEGMVVFEAGREPVNISGPAQEVFDVTGAGDVVAAVMTLAIVCGLGVATAAELANAAAGISVRHRGAEAVRPAELLRACGVPGAAPGVFTPDELAVVCGQWRAAGETIVFTNGCFDLFHPGHLGLLSYAAGLGDRLVVGVDSDSSVRRLKGPGRPVLDERARTALIGALDAVDAVTVFDDGPLELIDLVDPAVLVKGADYIGDEVVGGQRVCARGGRVELAPLVDGYSTTLLMDRVRDSWGATRSVVEEGVGGP